MNTPVIFLANMKVTAIVEVIVMLLIAGMIGYLTSYLYYKGIYLRKINKLKSEKEELNKRISALEQTLKDKEQEIARLSKAKE
jgi:uncharacterized membrane protein (DUF106 family)